MVPTLTARPGPVLRSVEALLATEGARFSALFHPPPAHYH